MNSSDISEIKAAIQAALTPDLLKPKWKRIAAEKGTPYCGHCYHAAEALYWILGRGSSGYKPHYVKHEGETHWYLMSANGEVLDPTAEQFDNTPPYSQGRGCGFLTDMPSKRALKVIQRIRINE